jgi:hypothetical protein
MKTVRIQSSLTLVGLAAMLSVSACSKNDAAKSADSAAVAAATPITTEAPKVLEVGDIDMGRHIGPDMRITDKTDDFAPKDTIFASVDTKNAGTGKLTARWNFEDGKVVHVDSLTISPTADATTEFHIVKPAGWPVGKYTVHILLNDAEVKTKEFTVKKK